LGVVFSPNFNKFWEDIFKHRKEGSWHRDSQKTSGLQKRERRDPEKSATSRKVCAKLNGCAHWKKFNGPTRGVVKKEGSSLSEQRSIGRHT